MMIIADRKLMIKALKSLSLGKTIPRNPKGVNISIFPTKLIIIVVQSMVFITKSAVENIGTSLTILIVN